MLETWGLADFGSIKESRALLHESPARTRAAYLANYRSRRDNQRSDTILADGSTDYSKRDDHPAIPERAHRLLGPELRMLYIMRDPLARLISHYKHDHSRGLAAGTIEQALNTRPQLINNGRYGYQLEPWIDVFGEHRIMPVCFEHFVADPQAFAPRLAEFVGLPTPTSQTTTGDASHQNAAGEQPVAVGAWRRVVENDLYRHVGRRLIPAALKRKVLGSSTPPAAQSVDLIPETAERLAAAFATDHESLRRLYPSFEAPWIGSDLSADAGPQ